MAATNPEPAARRVGRYALLDMFASGGMATIHFGRQLGAAGFGRVVAIKRLHPHLAHDPEFTAMFLDEARIAARIRHPNVASTLDVVADGSELLIVMDYIAGEPLSRFIAKRQAAATPIPRAIASAIVGDALLGLHAAHEAKSPEGEPLGLVHRDVSPQNLLVGADGVTRVIDFGVAKAAGRMHVTREKCVKGKIAYMAPEQLSTQPVSRRSDVYSAAVVLWECLTGRRLLPADGNGAIEQVMLGDFDPPSRWVPTLAGKVDDVVMKGLARQPEARHASAREMAEALEAALPRASVLEVSAWVEASVGDSFAKQATRLADIERTPVIDALTEVQSFAGAGDAAQLDAATEARAPIEASHVRSRRAAPVVVVGALALALVLATGGVLSARAFEATPATAHVALEPLHLGVLTQASDAPRAAVVPTTVSSQDVAALVAPPSGVALAASSKPAPRKLPAARATQRPSCSVPYVLDANGQKRYKPECLE